jgi:glycosyltransferase involved in cell wall biosynthesis
VAGWSDAVTALTEEDAEQVRARGIEGCVAMPNPVRVPDQVPPMRGREHLVVYIGRLGAEKQVGQAIEAFARAAREDWRLEIYGQGPMEASLARAAAGADADVELMGTVTDVAPVLRRASLNILASRAEGLPMSVLEASAHGVPTLAYDSAPGVRQAVGPGGVLTAVGDLDGLAENLSVLMGDEARRERLANAAVGHARQFSADRLVGRWVGLWRSVVRAEDPKKVR